MEENKEFGDFGKKRKFLYAFIMVIFIVVIGVSIYLLTLKDSDNQANQDNNDNNDARTSIEENSPVKSWQNGNAVIPGAFADAEVVDLGDGRYRMYYALEGEASGFHGQVYSAISSDGINWTEEEGERRANMTFPDVIKLPDGRYRMYFQDTSHSIKSAISTDGLKFTDEPGTRVDKALEGYIFSEIGGQSTLILEDGTYIMVYSGVEQERYSSDVPNSIMASMYYATSNDGITWQKRGLAVDSKNSALLGWAHGAEPVQFGSEVRVYFWSYMGIYYVTYKNGTFSEPVFDFTNETDKTRVYPKNSPADPTLAKINDKWFLFYGQHKEGIFYATLDS